jgi:RND family efflux transporter MFP subunit
MPAIDWSNPSIHLVLAASGGLLILIGLLFYFLLAARLKVLALVVGVGGGVVAGLALGLHLIPAPSPSDDQKLVQTPPTPAPTTQELLDRFRKASPTERMTWLRRLPGSAAAWHMVERGNVTSSLVERGVLESSDVAEVVCKVHESNSSTKIASTIKWVIDEGTMVKKGQLLLELDDSELQDRLKAQKTAVEQKKAEQVQVQKQAEIDVEHAELTLEQAKQQLTLAQRDLKGNKGSDLDRKKGLELQVKQAQLLVKTRDFQASTAKARVAEARKAAQSALDTEIARVKELESDIANCKMNAPRDGLVIFHVPEDRHPFVLAQGEPVREGQKLLYLPDLSKMQVKVNVPEALIARVQRDQKAAIRVDAFPGLSLAGQVAKIATVGERWGDAKTYPVTIPLAGKTQQLKPGMSAEVRIQVEPRVNVLRVPGSALLGTGRDTICYVKAGEEVQERQVIAGLRDNAFVEIQQGLKEGEQVLRDPRALAKQLAENPAPRTGR